LMRIVGIDGGLSEFSGCREKTEGELLKGKR
jgi:hypothetical protein